MSWNLRAIANPITQVINANLTVPWIQNDGWTIDGAGKRTPVTTTVTVQAQVQAMSAGDLKHADSQNIQGVMRSVYMYGDVQGIVRATQQGGDVLQFPMHPGGPVANWLVSSVIETWSDWCHVIVTLQSPLV